MTDRTAWDPYAPPVAALTGVVLPDPGVGHFVPPPLPADLEDLRKADLIALAVERRLDTDGTRAVLIERLRDSVSDSV